MSKRMTAQEVDDQFEALKLTLEKEGDDLFSKGSDHLSGLSKNDQVTKIRAEADKLKADAEAFAGSAEGERLKAESNKLKAMLENYSDSDEGHAMLEQAKKRLAGLHDDETMQHALSLQKKAKRIIAVASKSEELVDLAAESNVMIERLDELKDNEDAKAIMAILQARTNGMRPCVVAGTGGLPLTCCIAGQVPSTRQVPQSCARPWPSWT